MNIMILMMFILQYYRKEGNEEVQKRINGRKRGPRKKIVTIQEPMKGYLMDSDDES